MTNWIIGHTDRFAAACAQRSIANWVSFEHTTDIGYFFTPSQISSDTRTDVEKLWWHSPLKYAPNAKTPTLFIHSEQDYRCWMSEGLSMFTALKRNGTPTRLVLFHGENHAAGRGDTHGHFPRGEPRAVPLGQAPEPHPPDGGDRGLVRPLSEVTQPLIYRRREGLPRPSLRLSIQTDE